MAQHSTEACVQDVFVFSCSFGCRSWSKPKRGEGRVGHVCSLDFGLNCSFTALEEGMMHASPSPAYTIPEPCMCLFFSLPPSSCGKVKGQSDGFWCPIATHCSVSGLGWGPLCMFLGPRRTACGRVLAAPVGLLQRRAGGDRGRTYKARHARNWARGEGTGLWAQAET